MRIEAIAGLQILGIICPYCELLFEIKEAHRSKTCPECGESLRYIDCEYVPAIQLNGGGEN